MQPNPDMSQLLRIVQSPAGQKLIEILQQSGGAQLETAIQKASKGDYADAQKSISALLENKEAKALLQQLGGTHE